MEYYKNLDLEPIKYFCEFDQIWKVEEWKDLKSYKGFYQVSDLGRVICIRKSKHRILLQRISPTGYLRTTLHLMGDRKTRHIHQLVAIVFLNHIPCGNDIVPNHKNFNKLDNQKINLEIVTGRTNSNQKHLESISKFTGVDYHINSQKWRSRISINNKVVHLGMFKTEIEANYAYENKLKEISR